MKGPGIAYGK